MNTMLDNLKAWFVSKNITSHTVAAFVVIAATAISTNQDLQQFVLSLFKAHPALGADIVLFSALILKYSPSSSPAGALAKARTIVASSTAPTASEVDAATIK